MVKNKKQNKEKNKLIGLIIFGISLVLTIIILISGIKIGFRNMYADMTISGWTNNCNLMLNKMQDSDTQQNHQNILIDLEGYTEDNIAYNQGITINSKCYELLNYPKQFKNKYIWFNYKLNENEMDNVKSFLVTSLGILVIILVVLAMFIGFNKYHDDDDDDDSGYY